MRCLGTFLSLRNSTMKICSGLCQGPFCEHCPWWTKVTFVHGGAEKLLWGLSLASIADPVCHRGPVPKLYRNFRPMQRVYLRGRKLRCWACSLDSEPKPYWLLHNSSNCWPDLHSNNRRGSFAAWRTRLSLSLTSRFRIYSRRFKWIGFSSLLIMTAHLRDTSGKGRTRRRTMRASR